MAETQVPTRTDAEDIGMTLVAADPAVPGPLKNMTTIRQA